MDEDDPRRGFPTETDSVAWFWWFVAIFAFATLVMWLWLR